MTDSSSPIIVTILNREYRVNCPTGDEEALTESAKQLDQRMHEIKQTGKVVGTERVAVMAALNIINELANANLDNPAYEKISYRLDHLHDRLDQQIKLFE